MGWEARLAGQFVVLRGDVELGPAPTHTTATLLVGLLDSRDTWIDRATLSALLFPDGDEGGRRNALRQCLHRLRRWVGTEALEESGSLLRLSPGNWALQLVLADGSAPSSSQIAPGPRHPWMDQIRIKWGRTLQPSKPWNDLARAVESIAREDRETALKVLLAGVGSAVHLSVQELAHLLEVTRPATVEHPLIGDFLELRGFLQVRTGFIGPCLGSYRQAYEVAHQRKQRRRMNRCASSLSFVCTERGQMAEANMWIGRLLETSRAEDSRLQSVLARSSFLWQAGDAAAAVSKRREVMDESHTWDRPTQCEFWANLALLAAESRDVGLYRESSRQARETMVPGLERWMELKLGLAEATHEFALYHYDYALQRFEDVERMAVGAEFEVTGWYAIEGQAEALSGAGFRDRALKRWADVEGRRLSKCKSLTPRLRARRARILASSN